MGTSVVTEGFVLLCVFLLCGPSLQTETEKHSLYYIYTALSKPVDLPGIHQFTAMGLLDDREIDYYNSQVQKKIPKQHWMQEKMQEDYWEKGTQSRKSKEQWFNVNVDILMKRMGHNESDVHVLQWRHGCEIEKQGSEVRFSKGIDEYSYDGKNFLSFDDKESQWVAPVAAALPTKRKWDNVPILNQYTKGYLEKECVDWLNKFREYGDEEIRNGSSPKVHVFAKRCTSDKTKLKLTCFATGFYPKDVTLLIRKYRTSLAEDEIESSGIRPNHDGTFQLKKSVIIQEDEKADYDCFVAHRTLKELILMPWDGKCQDCTPETIPGMIGAVIGGVLVLAVVAVVLIILKKRNIIAFKSRKDQEPSIDEESVGLKAGPESASNKSDSNVSSSQEESDGGLNSVKSESKCNGDTDSGQESAGSTPDTSPSNSQEAVNQVSETSSVESQPTEGQSLLPQPSQ